MIILPELTPVKARNSIAPFIGMTISMAGVIGPILGGAFSSHWQWVFWIKSVRFHHSGAPFIWCPFA